VFGHLLLGLIDLAAGVVALVWPAPTAFVLVIVVAAWAQITAGIQLRHLGGDVRSLPELRHAA
jgi:uncharacterized membrane protein HdeD (DUF308 family)